MKWMLLVLAVVYVFYASVERWVPGGDRILAGIDYCTSLVCFVGSQILCKLDEKR